MHNRNLLFVGMWILLVCVGSAPVHAVTRLDATFGLNGRVAVELGVKTSAHAVVVQPDGKIVVAGSSSKKTALNFSLLRFNKDGSLDTTFNGDGSVITSVSIGDDEALALGLLSDGRIVAAGYSHNGTDRDFALVCYRQDGSLDPTFGIDGVVVTSIGNGNEEITAMTINAEDVITVAGATEGTTGRVLVTARYFADGALDGSFGEQGVSLIGVGDNSAGEGIIERKNGSLVVSGSYAEKKVFSLMLVGLSADGVLDTSFGDKGVVVPSGTFAASEGFGLAEDSDGLIYLAGSVGLAGKRDTALFRFTKAGKADASFGDKGVVVTRVSGEDDVLYDVTVDKRGVVASGYTTDAGTRQFLLVSCSGDSPSPPPSPPIPSLTTSAKTAPKRSADRASTKTMPVQEVRVNGRTRVQIRRLQVSSSYSDFSTVHNIPSLPSPDFEIAGAPVQARTVHRQVDERAFFVRLIPSVIKQFGNFLMPPAIAADSGNAIATDTSVSPQVVTTTFSEGESVSYAATVDALGNVIAVGTADGTGGSSSIVVARYAAEPLADSIVDQPGYRSGSINTTPPADITMTTAVAGFEIVPSFGKVVTKRGVVFSTRLFPVYSGSSSVSRSTGSGSAATIASSTAGGELIRAVDVEYRSIAGASFPVIDTAAFFMQRTLGRVTGFLVSDVVAAPAGSTSTPIGIHGRTNSPTDDFVEDGETENGSGYGKFSALLEKLKPGTTYYVRAYALTSDGVYYGNQLRFRTADACFVATASFGTLLHPSVKVLRDFRDSFLVNNIVGQQLVALYYTYSPAIADFIAKYDLLRVAVRIILLPFIGFSWLALQGGMVFTLSIFVGTAAMFSWLFLRIRRRA